MCTDLSRCKKNKKKQNNKKKTKQAPCQLLTKNIKQHMVLHLTDRENYQQEGGNIIHQNPWPADSEELLAISFINRFNRKYVCRQKKRELGSKQDISYCISKLTMKNRSKGRERGKRGGAREEDRENEREVDR